jgi:23S rRNA pseudouridine1911/1915/1917 synthase
MRWQTSTPDDGVGLSGFLKGRNPDQSWRDVKRLVETGKVFVDGVVERSPGRRLTPGQQVEVRMSAPRRERPAGGGLRIVHEDVHVIVVDKPSGVSSVPFTPDDAAERERASPAHGEVASAMNLVREVWRRERRKPGPLYKVHRIDKPTSGLLVYARTEDARRVLFKAFRAHEIERTYRLVAHGTVESRTIDANMVKDRGDGLRGVTKVEGLGKRAVTHVRALEGLGGGAATLCEARLETGRTHQIRVHLAEAGHPLVGERVYVRDLQAKGRTAIESPRLLLHAATLGFVHPVSGEPLSFEAPLPPDFVAVLERLRRGGPAAGPPTARAPGGPSPAPGGRRRRRRA